MLQILRVEMFSRHFPLENVSPYVQRLLRAVARKNSRSLQWSGVKSFSTAEGDLQIFDKTPIGADLN